jgi:hypothetical protein
VGFRVQPASAEDDAALRQLLSDLGLTVPSAWWGRCFSEAAPAAAQSVPWIARDDNGIALAFAAVRGAQLRYAGQTVPAAVLHDFIAREGDTATAAADALVAASTRQRGVALCAGTGTHATKLLSGMHWHMAGVFVRAHAEGARRPGIRPVPAGTLALDWEAEEGRLCAAGIAHLTRDPAARQWQSAWGEGAPTLGLALPGEAAALLRAMPARDPRRREWLVIDLVLGTQPPGTVFRALRETLAATGDDAYLSFFGPSLEVLLAEAGWRLRAPRWPLFWNLTDPRYQVVGQLLHRQDEWLVTPLDMELDRTGD